MDKYPYGGDRKAANSARCDKVLGYNDGGGVKGGGMGGRYANGGRVKGGGDTSISITVQPPAPADKNPLAALAAAMPPPGPAPGGPPPGAPPPGGAPLMPPGMGGPGAGGMGMKTGGRTRMKTGGAAKPRKALGGPQSMFDPTAVAPTVIAPTPRPPSVMNPVAPNVAPAVQAAQAPRDLSMGFGRRTGGRVPKMDAGAGGGKGRLEKARGAKAL